MRKIVTPWTDARIADLAKWWEEGLSCSQIAGRLGNTTRNAVIGKIHRLGLPGSPKRLSVKRVPKAPRVNKPHIRIVPMNGNSNHFRVIQSVESDPSEIRCVEVVPLHKSLIDLVPDDCRYPYGDGPFTFCGHPIGGGSYCPSHSRLVKIFTRPTFTREQLLEKRRVYTASYRASKRIQQAVFG